MAAFDTKDVKTSIDRLSPTITSMLQKKGCGRTRYTPMSIQSFIKILIDYGIYDLNLPNNANTTSIRIEPMNNRIIMVNTLFNGVFDMTLYTTDLNDKSLERLSFIDDPVDIPSIEELAKIEIKTLDDNKTTFEAQPIVVKDSNGYYVYIGFYTTCFKGEYIFFPEQPVIFPPTINPKTGEVLVLGISGYNYYRSLFDSINSGENPLIPAPPFIGYNFFEVEDGYYQKDLGSKNLGYRKNIFYIKNGCLQSKFTITSDNSIDSVVKYSNGSKVALKDEYKYEYFAVAYFGGLKDGTQRDRDQRYDVSVNYRCGIIDGPFDIWDNYRKELIHTVGTINNRDNKTSLDITNIEELLVDRKPAGYLRKSPKTYNFPEYKKIQEWINRFSVYFVGKFTQSISYSGDKKDMKPLIDYYYNSQSQLSGEQKTYGYTPEDVKVLTNNKGLGIIVIEDFAVLTRYFIDGKEITKKDYQEVNQQISQAIPVKDLGPITKGYLDFM
jgi:hypothetical protein